MQRAENHAIVFDVFEHIHGIDRIGPAILHSQMSATQGISLFQQPLTLGVIRLHAHDIQPGRAQRLRERTNTCAEVDDTRRSGDLFLSRCAR